MRSHAQAIRAARFRRGQNDPPKFEEPNETENDPLISTQRPIHYGVVNETTDEQELNNERIDTYFSEPEVEVPISINYSFSLKKLWAFTGPGLLMSIAFLDPGNIQADLQSASIAQYNLLWVLMWATYLGLLVQRLAARLGVVTGLHLAELCYKRYPKVPRLLIWIMIEIAIIGSDMQEVIGTAIAFYLISNQKIPLWGGVLITIIDTFTFLLIDKYGLRKLEAFFAVLVALMALTFGFEYIKSEPNQLQLLKGLTVPYCSGCGSVELMQAIGLIGAMISPHNLFLHSALVKSRNILRTNRSEVNDANRYVFIDSAIVLTITLIINIFVSAVFAQGLYGRSNSDIYDICLNTTIPHSTHVFPNNNLTIDADLHNAGIYLGCQYGAIALYIWAIGLYAAGQSSTMTGTYSGQFVMEGFLNLHWSRWKRVLLTRSIAIVPTLALTYYQNLDKLSEMNDLMNALMSLQLPFALIPALTFTSSYRVMGQFANGLVSKVFASVLCVAIIAINLYFVYDYVNNTFHNNVYVIVFISLFFIFYTVFLLYLTSCLLVVFGLNCLTRIPRIGEYFAETEEIEYSYGPLGNEPDQSVSTNNAVIF